jgi:adenosylhomocysteine nucleosidase
MIGIMSAMDEEIAVLIERLELQEKRIIANREYMRGILYGHEVVLSLSRWGKVAASQTTTTLITVFNVEKIIFTGVAGGADPSLSIGDIVISTELVQHDVDASPIPPLKRFEIPLIGISHFKADESLIEKAMASAQAYVTTHLYEEVDHGYLKEYSITTPKIVKGLIASGDLFIADAKKIHELRHALPGLQCIEMEGAAVAQVCYEHDIPFVVIRAISDKSDHSAVMDFPKFVKYIDAHYSNGIIRGMLEPLAGF